MGSLTLLKTLFEKSSITQSVLSVVQNILGSLEQRSRWILVYYLQRLLVLHSEVSVLCLLLHKLFLSGLVKVIFSLLVFVVDSAYCLLWVAYWRVRDIAN